MGEAGRSLDLLGGGVFVRDCNDCVAEFNCCVVVLDGEEGSHLDGICLCGAIFFVLGVLLEGCLRKCCEWCASLMVCVFGVGAVVVFPLCIFRYLLSECLDVLFGYRVWNVWGMVWVMGVLFFPTVKFVLCRDE